MPLRGLQALTARLFGLRRQKSKPAAAAHPVMPAGRLVAIRDFGTNPGRLRMYLHLPGRLSPQAGLVVVLHGCIQTAAGYDRGAGWATLADRYGFALLLPEQTRFNNPRLCFNWFRPGDTGRDRGEAASIRQAVARVLIDYPALDRRRVFVTGLSAGGAMTNVMLAIYPEVFAAGAIIAGVPFGCANGVQQALEAMNPGRTRPARAWGDLVRAASRCRGPWPRVSVWHGDADTVVTPVNAGEIVKQWTDLHGLPETPSEADRLDGQPRRLWRGAGGGVVIEQIMVEGMAHGTPLAIAGVAEPHGVAGPFLLDVGIDSSLHIARFFGLLESRGPRRPEPAGQTSPRPSGPRPALGGGMFGAASRLLRSFAQRST
ncbi:alpha/beta hydrolase family esterase [Blastochloris viridis]|uniref:Poly(3-hydroxyalkanoate) depolymerase n=1 Tax=Blastochloris viridis TaxID=1079 RepID=A0A0H5BF78_BLAVI|nr:PHB depolymerase family esterase [Blastochloris viridis]ALK10312.1 Esterase PHB depolymerase [Blastochloris viridis]BAR99754.1 poly(3-hydroxyalkanoate) depolymerase [Blastochloris viridis]CUU42974.1 Poly(3-hydroxybutyrate) depolymerase [Blastochloris viridis]